MQRVFRNHTILQNQSQPTRKSRIVTNPHISIGGPFGEVAKKTGAANGQPFNYSTKYQDETGLVMYPRRSYLPSTGRWLSRDPISERGGANVYCYVRNRPIDFSDSKGLKIDAFTLDPSTFPVSPSSGPSLAGVGGRTDIEWAAHADITFGTPTSWGLFYVSVKGHLDQKAYYNQDLISDPNAPGSGGASYTVVTHERLHVASNKAWWNGLKVEVDPFEKFYCTEKCAKLAKDAANKTSTYYFNRAVLDSATLHDAIGQPLSKLETTIRIDTTTAPVYWNAWAAFTAAGCTQ